MTRHDHGLANIGLGRALGDAIGGMIVVVIGLSALSGAIVASLFWWALT